MACTSTTPCDTQCRTCEGLFEYLDTCPQTVYEICADFSSACDACTSSWVLVADLGQGDWNADESGLEFDVQKIGALQYHNTYCIKHYAIQENSCISSFWGCGQGTYDCCVCRFGSTICNDSDTC